MAQPISFEAPTSSKPDNLERLRNASADHADAVLSGYELLQALHDQGLLNLLRGLVSGGDAVVGTVAAVVNTPEAIGAIRNFVLLSKLFASVPPDVLQSLVETVSAGAKREKAHKAPGLFSLLRRLRNEDSRHAASIALDLLEGLGRGL